MKNNHSIIIEFLNLITQRDDLQEEIKNARNASDIFNIANIHGYDFKYLHLLAKTIDSLKKKEKKGYVVFSEEKFALNALQYFPNKILEELESRGLSPDGWQ